MKTFPEYMKLRELAAYELGGNLLGTSSLDTGAEDALTAAFKAFEIILSSNPTVAAQFLNRMTETNPEIRNILKQHGLESFNDSNFRVAAKRGAIKGSKVISKGFGDMNSGEEDFPVNRDNSGY